MVRKIQSLQIDGEDVDELVGLIESAFEVKVCVDEPLQTLGELHDFLMQASQVGSIRGPCLSAVVFYRLRHALRQNLAHGSLTPLTDLARTHHTVRRQSARAFWQKVGQSAGLRLPEPEISILGCCIISLFLAGFVAAAVYGDLVLVSLSLGSAVVLGAVWPPKLGPDHANTRDFVRHVVALNYGKLSRELGVARPRDSWTALCTLVSHVTGVAASALSPSTRFE